MAANSDNSSSKIPGWVWLFTGTMLGALIMFLMQLSEVELKPKRETASTSKKAEPEKEVELSFYERLKNQVVPVSKPKNDPQQSAPKKAVDYYLQVASFVSEADAEDTMVKLILLDMSAKVEQAEIRGETWHRVVVGPFANRSEMELARQTLLTNNYNPARRERPKSP